ncbi:alpha-galactosidase [Eurytemora carolleeae]|uniref:alpha-galactosidase n=1 Tax=Eurytemora carolleeae TaxID=1294199 RepID=UPI000C794EA2|nr:alpha-galactosidase [Eurytemora carolleeae]|eukprot:XP_023332001.1 alpha-galactosidase-like [Eurytemora affinis]
MLPAVFVLIGFIGIQGLPDGLHPTPPMGWTSWNTFFEFNSESKMISQAEAILDLGLDKVGYNILTIDDFWQLPSRDNETGRMIPDPEKFPNGILALSNYFHERGLKIGIYSSAGRFTCSGNLPGSLSYEKTDVEMLLEYEIDYFKYDNCFPQIDGRTNINGSGVYIDWVKSFEHLPSIWQDPSEEERYSVMADEIKNVKNIRNITLELCAWGFGNVEQFGNKFGHLWRTSADIADNWNSMLYNIDVNDENRFRGSGVQGPNSGWNYPDGLFIGKGGMTDVEYQTMFALWCLVKSPLMLGTDMTKITRESEAYRIITNPFLIAVNQDPLGIQGQCLKDCCSHGSMGGLLGAEGCIHFHHSWQVWGGPLSGNSFVVVVINRFDVEKQILMNWSEDAMVPAGVYSVQDLWTGDIVDSAVVGGEDWEGGDYQGILPPHANWAFKLTPV